MKRLILPLIVAVVCAITAPALAQSKDFAGSWTLDVEKSGTKDGPPTMTSQANESSAAARSSSFCARWIPDSSCASIDRRPSTSATSGSSPSPAAAR